MAWRFEKNAAVVVEGCLRQGSLACFLTRPWSQPHTTGSPRNVQRSSIPNKKAPDVVLHEAKRFSFLASDHLASRMGHRNDRYNICVLMRICGFRRRFRNPLRQQTFDLVEISIREAIKATKTRSGIGPKLITGSKLAGRGRSSAWPPRARGRGPVVAAQAAGGRISLAELRWRMTNDAMPRARRGVDRSQFQFTTRT